ncbi:uncharacterized protein Ecym_8180 [Eremothecium cymbalariae DBVPG|uniref:Uncharacterized protein n=1 Tax=Eremothecium cymbalariae (strain CBS 270.75 / DBVPG 7215 / KCTC 17166 / NRRL Y-17582) TaxID=931890 RepID=G8JX92_ERECY|nr:Hypothetical protein Ecym_8180 [Eremothecium cymbalariae DBVPG\
MSERNINRTYWSDEWFLLPESIKPKELKSFLTDSDKIGSFSFMWFTVFIISLLAYMIFSFVYEYSYAMKKRIQRRHEEALISQKPIWISICDYHTKLSPAAQDAYLEYSQRMFEQLRGRLEVEKAQSTAIQNAKTKAEEELNGLKRLTAWACKRAHFSKWKFKEQRHIILEDMV